MSITVIPGLSFIPDEEGDVTELHSFSGTIKVPEAHRYGNCRPRNDFVNLGTIYEGNFAKIYKCQDKKNGEIYALKKLIFTPAMMINGIPLSFLQEIKILLILKHDNIVNLHGTIAGKKLESNLLLLDYCITSLQEVIEKKCDAIFERDVVKYMMRQLFDGINFIHESKIVHRNISCRNLLFTERGLLKISGIRTARFYDKEGMSPVVTELMYRAPELLFNSKSYGAPVDLWSAGCVFAYLLLKKPLFSGDSELAVSRSIFSAIGTPSDDIWPGFDDMFFENEKFISEELAYSDLNKMLFGIPVPSVQLLKDLIVFYPDARLPASEVLKSPYIINAPPGCPTEKMVSILKKALTAPPQSLEEDMLVDS